METCNDTLIDVLRARETINENIKVFARLEQAVPQNNIESDHSNASKIIISDKTRLLSSKEAEEN